MTSAATVVDATCPFCGPKPIHVDTGRCQNCGRQVRAPGLADAATARNGHSSPPAAPPSPDIAAAPKPDPFHLPASPRTRACKQARALHDSFLRGAENAEAAAKAATAEAQRYRKAAAVFAQLLDQVDVEPAEETGDRARRAVAAAGAWSAHAPACIDCGRSDRRHVAHGRCSTCDTRWRTARVRPDAAA